jgi:amidase
VRYPKWFLDSNRTATYTLFPPEFEEQLGDYLKTLKPGFPRSLDEMIEKSYTYTSMGEDGKGPNPVRWRAFVERDKANGTMKDPGYLALVNYYMPMSKALTEGIIAKDKLDAIVYPTSSRRPEQIAGGVSTPMPTGASVSSPTSIANLSGSPDLIVPAGFTTDDLPVTISFFGPNFSEPKLLALGYAFEQLTHAIRRPVNTPALSGGTIEVPGQDVAAAN